MIEMESENQRDRLCAIPGCGKELPHRPGSFKICDECRKLLIDVLGETGRSTGHENVRRQVSNFIKSGLTIEGYKAKLAARKPYAKSKGKTLECPLVSKCTLAKTASEDDILCHGGKHAECSTYKKLTGSDIKEKQQEEDNVVSKTDERQVIDETTPDESGDHGDQHVDVGKSPDHGAEKNTEQALIEEIIAPIMIGMKKASTLLAERGMLKSVSKENKENTVAQVAEMLDAFKRDFTAMFDKFKTDTRSLVEAKVKGITKDYKATETLIKEFVAKEVAIRFRFMTSTYEEHLKDLEAEENEKKRKELLKDMQDS